ncbi:MAG: hypothetical protein DMD46_02645 [Gemmatimonadetes bacterium]|nr:MAG: hypothetical protein DMD46_02645 [Gemmatimonadota bacterium]
MSIPFTVYDFFGLLSTGVIWLLGIDHAFGMRWILGKQLGAGEAVLWIVVSYVIGHINSQGAAWLFERQLVARRLGYPSTNLFADKNKKTPRLFKHYREPLPGETTKAILKRYESLSGSKSPSEAMFIFCFNLVKERSPTTYGRLQTFLNVYGFCRNMSFAALLLSVVFVAAAVIRGVYAMLYLALISVFAAAVLFFRYIKFFRLFGREVFVSLLGLEERKST